MLPKQYYLITDFVSERLLQTKGSAFINEREPASQSEALLQPAQQT